MAGSPDQRGVEVLLGGLLPEISSGAEMVLSYVVCITCTYTLAVCGAFQSASSTVGTSWTTTQRSCCWWCLRMLSSTSHPANPHFYLPFLSEPQRKVNIPRLGPKKSLRMGARLRKAGSRRHHCGVGFLWNVSSPPPECGWAHGLDVRCLQLLHRIKDGHEWRKMKETLVNDGNPAGFCLWDGTGAKAWLQADTVPCVPQMDSLNMKDGENRWIEDKTSRDCLIFKIHHHLSNLMLVLV